MPPDERVVVVMDEYLDQALRGDPPKLESFLAGHPELLPAERQQIASLAENISANCSSQRAGVILSNANLPSERIGDFRLIRRLGEGGMGLVFLAEQESLGRMVALKILRPEQTGSPDAVERIRREALAIGKLHHPNIVTVLTCGEDKGVHYIAMDLVRGQSLAEVLANAVESGKSLPIPTVLRLTLAIARALQCAHQAGIVHRDVKPSNVRIGPEGQVVLVDFGVARDLQSKNLTSSGAFWGTPHYCSPEQVAPERIEIDARTDVYSLGVLLYECVTGRVPFDGDTSEQVFHQILVKEHVPARRWNPNVSRELDAVISMAIEKERDRRYATAESFAEDLDALFEFRSIRAKPASPIRRLAKWTRRNRSIALAVGTVFLSIVGLAGSILVEQLRSSRAVERELATCEHAVLRGDFALALQAVERARALAPESRVVLQREYEVQGLKRRRAGENARAESRAAIEEADRTFEHFHMALNLRAELEDRVRPLTHGQRERRLSEAETQTLAQGERRLAALQPQIEEAFWSVTDSLRKAERLDPGNELSRRRMADLYMYRVREARRNKDTANAAVYRRLVEKSDLEHRYEEELRGLGRVSLASEPPGADVYFFRYVEHSAIVSDGEFRLVPVPVGEMTLPVPPGTWGLCVMKRKGSVEEGDLVLKVAGHPIEGSVLVAEAHGEIKRFDRLVKIDGKPIRREFDVGACLQKSDNSDGLHTFEFERGETHFTVRGDNPEPMGIVLLEPADLIERMSVPGEVFHLGEVRSVTIPAGLQTSTTAAPLYLFDDTCIGKTPLEKDALEPGSYLALLRREGFEDQRCPFVIADRLAVNLIARLNPVGTSPEGFVFVPGGPFTAGTDDDRYLGWARGSKDVGPFWMMRHEVTLDDMAECLNDPEVKVIIERSPEPILFPRSLENAKSGGYWPRGADGRFGVPSALRRLPAFGINWRDAYAVAKWRTLRAHARGEPFEYFLPTGEEWEKAARGVDERVFPYGNHFDQSWMRTLHSTARLGPAPRHVFPIDESPYGVFDLGGNVVEWTTDRSADDFDIAIRGGGWRRSASSQFAAPDQSYAAALSISDGLGFRLVARRIP